MLPTALAELGGNVPPVKMMPDWLALLLFGRLTIGIAPPKLKELIPVIGLVRAMAPWCPLPYAGFNAGVPVG